MKNSWLIGIITVAVLFMSFITTLVVKTYQHKVDLVSDDYYAQELNYQNQLAKINNVSEEEKVKWKLTGEEIVFQFPSSKGSISGTIEFFRPSDSSLDRKLPISTDAEGKQYFSTKLLATGYYKVKLDWEKNNTSYYMEEGVYIP